MLINYKILKIIYRISNYKIFDAIIMVDFII